MFFQSFGVGDLVGCWVVSSDGGRAIVVVVVKSYSGGYGGMLVVDHCPQVAVFMLQSIEFL